MSIPVQSPAEIPLPNHRWHEKMGTGCQTHAHLTMADQEHGDAVTSTRADLWKSWKGPAEWFSLRYPFNWSLSSSDGTVFLDSSDGLARLAIHCFWHRRPQDARLEDVASPSSVFRSCSNVRRLKSLSIPYTSVAFEGWSSEGDEPAWWKRPFVRRVRSRFRLWGVREQSVYLVAALQQESGECDPEVESIATLILTTLKFADHLAEPPEVFAERTVELARDRFPLLESRRGDGFSVRLGDASMNLANFYRSYVQSPDRFEHIVLPALAALVQVSEWGDDQTFPPLESVRGRIMPMLFPGRLRSEEFADVAGTNWIAGLRILYVVDESQTYWYIQKQLLAEWQLSEAELHEIALKNLEAYFGRKEMELTATGDRDRPSLLMPNGPDAYNTVRLLDRNFSRSLQSMLGREFAVGIPNRDFFVAFRLDCEETVNTVRAQVAHDHACMDHPLTDRLLLVSADGVSEFCD